MCWQAGNRRLDREGPLIARYVSMAVFLALVVLVAAIGGSFMAPYLVWLVFIWALSLTIWTMNGGPFSSLLL
jgi:tryptophan-rich sensory protein